MFHEREQVEARIASGRPRPDDAVLLARLTDYERSINGIVAQLNERAEDAADALQRARLKPTS